MVGFVESLWPIITSGAVLPELSFVLAAFATGYFGGKFASNGQDHLEDIGALGTAQRNTAAAMVIATQNFEDPQIRVTLTLINVLGLLMLMLMARRLSHDNRASS